MVAYRYSFRVNVPPADYTSFAFGDLTPQGALYSFGIYLEPTVLRIPLKAGTYEEQNALALPETLKIITQ